MPHQIWRRSQLPNRPMVANVIPRAMSSLTSVADPGFRPWKAPLSTLILPPASGGSRLSVISAFHSHGVPSSFSLPASTAVEPRDLPHHTYCSSFFCIKPRLSASEPNCCNSREIRNQPIPRPPALRHHVNRRLRSRRRIFLLNNGDLITCGDRVRRLRRSPFLGPGQMLASGLLRSLRPGCPWSPCAAVAGV